MLHPTCCDHDLATLRSARRGFALALRRWLNTCKRGRERRRSLAQLNGLSSAALRDIGLTRADVLAAANGSLLGDATRRAR